MYEQMDPLAGTCCFTGREESSLLLKGPERRKETQRLSIKDQVSQFENKLRAAISDKVSGHLQEAKGSLGGFEGLEKEIESRISQLAGIQGGGAQKQPSLGGFHLPFKLPVQ